MVTVTFPEHTDVVTVRNELWQYDVDQILEVHGLNLPSVCRIDFSFFERDDLATSVDAVTDEFGVTRAEIPNSFLWFEENEGANYKIFAFIYVTDEEAGETVKKIKMTVNARPKAEGVIEPIDKPMWDMTVEQMRQYMEEALEHKNAAFVSKEAARESEVNAKLSEEAAYASELRAKESENVVVEAENVIKTTEEHILVSEVAAKASELNAKDSELAAKTSEDNAKESEQKARAYRNEAETFRTNANQSKSAAQTYASQSQTYASASLSRMNQAADYANKAKTASDSLQHMEVTVRNLVSDANVCRDDSLEAAINANNSEIKAKEYLEQIEQLIERLEGLG